MSRIEMRGVIVPSAYDSDWTQEYIAKGLITPESKFRRELAEAPTDQPLDLYVNSPGGSVFAANEMVNAVREWKAANGQKAVVTIGAMAASAASAFAISVGSLVRVHRNSKMMFHGAWTEAVGGKDALEDTAKLIGKINAETQQTLVQKYKIDPDMVAEWFAEGREGWLSAEEMIDSGIAAEIIEDDADAPVYDKAAVDAMDAGGLNIAALVDVQQEEPESSGPEQTEVDDADKPEHGEDAPGPVEETEEYKAGLEAGRSQMACEVADAVTDATKAVKDAEARASAFQSEKDRLTAELAKVRDESDRRCADLRAQLDQATERLRQYVAGALQFAPAIETWEQALAECGGDYVKAKQQYPELCSQYRAAQRQKGR
jgi:ATP-dependent protease ClpP protease subunit